MRASSLRPRRSRMRTNQPSTATFWKVRSVRDGLISAFSTEASATTAPPIAAPTGVTAIAISTTRIQIDWTAVPQAVKYYVWESAGGGANVLRGTVLAGNPPSFVAASLTAGTNYCYQVQTVGTDSQSALSSPPACATP